MRRKYFALLSKTQPSIQRHYLCVRQLGAFNGQINLAYFALTTEENKHISGFLIAVNILQAVDNHLIAITFHVIRVVVDNLDRKAATRDFDYRRIIKMFGKLGDINGR